LPKVFLLDPEYAESSTPRFLRRGVERAGWDLARPRFFQLGMDGVQWFADFTRGLADAEIIVSLGDFIGLAQQGERLGEALDQLSKKIDDGCPVVFSGASKLAPPYPGTRSDFTDVTGQVREVLGTYGIHITPIKVASSIKEVQIHNSQLCCVFDSADDELLDPQLCDGVDELVAYGNRLISYDPGIFPIIEAGRTRHFLALLNFEWVM
jgi:hypothetical protein